MLCVLGQPECVSADGARAVDWVREACAGIFVCLVVDMGLAISGKDHYLLLEFDEAGALFARRELEHGFSSSTGSVGPLGAEECERMLATGVATLHR